VKQAAEISGVPLRVIRDVNAEARAFYRAALILVRPDQFVAWVSSDGADVPENIMRRAIGG
jgi:hypothetical protein